MFPYKSNAFHAYETNRNPLILRFFVYLIAIASTFGVLVFTEARADLDDEYCDFIEQSIEDAVWVAKENQKVFSRLSAEGNLTGDKRATLMRVTTQAREEASEWATIYNAVCK